MLPLAFDMEEGILAALAQLGKSSPSAGVTLNALAVASAHILEVIAKFSPDNADLREPFVDVFKSTYEYYKEHPTDTDAPFVKSMLN